jgi:hypothetical protein
MSNHAGSYLLAEVLEILRRHGVFDLLGPATSRQMVIEIVKRACRHYDCNPGETLEEEGAALGICCGCMAQDQELQDGLCRSCRR